MAYYIITSRGPKHYFYEGLTWDQVVEAAANWGKSPDEIYSDSGETIPERVHLKQANSFSPALKFPKIIRQNHFLKNYVRKA